MCTREQCPERRPMEWCNSGGALPTMLPGRVGEKLRPQLGRAYSKCVTGVLAAAASMG